MGRPFKSANEHVYALQQYHNELVAPDDEVLVVGDAVYQKATEWLPHVAHFNGRKTLIRGNHDRPFTDEQLKPYFEHIVGEGGGFFIQCGGIPCYVTHYPTEGVNNAFNLVGHIHAAWKYQLNMVNIGVDVHHFRPVSLDKIPFHFEAVCKYYDRDVWVAYEETNAQFKGKRGKTNSYFRP